MSHLLIGAFIGLVFALVGFGWFEYPFSHEEYLSGIGWLGKIVSSLFPWPFLVLLLFAFSPARRAAGHFFDSVTEFFRGLAAWPRRADEIEFWFLKARQDPERAKTLVRGQTQGIEQQFDEMVSRLVDDKNIDALFGQFFTGHLTGLVDQSKLKQPKDHFRATLHFKDPLYPRSLYQLLDYQSSTQLVPQRRGRRKSTRFGIIGKAWRSKALQYDPRVDVDPQKLIEKWGMTGKEATKAGKGQKSHLALAIPKDDPFYVVFMDGTPEYCFGPDSDKASMECKIVDAAARSELTKRLLEFKSEIQSVEPILTTGP